MKPIVKCENISKSYIDHSKNKPFFALKDISFEVHPGDRIGLIGLNGSGKSTLLKILSGHIKPTSGLVELAHQPIALSHFDSMLHPDLTGIENIKLQFRLLKNQINSDIDVNQAIKEVKDFSELGEFINQPVKTYSSGMMLRLTFSIFKVVEPKILLLDEVFSAGDIVFQKKVELLMKNHLNNADCIVMASHNLSELTKYCERVIHLENGKMVWDGDKYTSIERYQINTESIYPGLSQLKSQSVLIQDIQNMKENGIAIKHLSIEPNALITVTDEIKFNFIVVNSLNSYRMVKFSLDIYNLSEQLIITTSPCVMDRFSRGFLNSEIECSVILPPILINVGIYYLTFTFFNSELEKLACFQKAAYFKISFDESISHFYRHVKSSLIVDLAWDVKLKS